jgi:hypothetical protein
MLPKGGLKGKILDFIFTLVGSISLRIVSNHVCMGIMCPQSSFCKSVCMNLQTFGILSNDHIIAQYAVAD